MAAATPTYTGYGVVDGAQQLELWVTPPVGQPGDALSLLLRLTNRQAEAAAPAVTVQLPPGLHLATRSLPAGVTYSPQARLLTWLPVAPGGDGVVELDLPLRVETADLQHPGQVVTAVLRPTASGDAAGHTAEAAIWLGIPPQILSIGDVGQVAAGQPVQLRAQLGGSGPFTLVWFLGDGRRVEVAEPEVVYPLPGVYEITLQAANPLQRVSRTYSLTVLPHPEAQFRTDDWEVSVGQPVAFINESGGQGPVAYQWDFGDGGTSTLPNPTHQYAAPGSYLVRLRIDNSFGRSEATGVVTVGLPPVADMVLADSVAAGAPLTGQAYGDGTVQAYTWDMGDGRQVSGERITYTYRRSGDYYVLLSAANAFGITQVGRWVHVDPGISLAYLPAVPHAAGRAGGTAEDPSLAGLNLEPVALSEAFVLQPVPEAADLTPAEALYFYVNLARAQFDLPPLTLVHPLSVAAQQHTADMARFGYTGHTGADGTYPAERLLVAGYGGGYAGEATAWGFGEAYQAVEFWVNSPSHRRIILNRFATNLGVGFTVDFNAPNVWYWTAEFGDALGAPVAPALRLQAPADAYEALVTTAVSYRWTWARPLAPGEEFVVYLYDERQAIPLGRVTQPLFDNLYALAQPAYPLLEAGGAYRWQVRLQQGDAVLAESALQALTLLPDDSLPTPTPLATLVPPTPTPGATLTPTPAIVWPTETPEPTAPPPPVFPTATPQP
ncbi:MAG: PKD domain-containing protein [Anaerolineales bacterium]|nr:PKD domain-containing protein [Anaerolineales bacterium]